MWKRMALAFFVSLFLVGADQRVCPGQNPETQTFRMNIETNFDESAGVANYHIVVEEGKPYQMGEVLIKNASQDEEKRIRGKWQMAQGAVFNVEYVKSFIKKMFDDRSGRAPRVRLQPDSSKQIANVLFTF
jgi:outer membrane protein assembly factor BamA